MLEEIVVSNLGLIPEASLEPAEGLTVITGETGAGKTVMLGALRLLTGQQAGKGSIGPHGDASDVSARFVGGEEVVVRRVVTATRSKAYLDGVISTASALKDALGDRVSIVGQHDQHTITSGQGVRSLLDRALSTDEKVALDAYRDAWTTYTTVRQEADLLGSDHRELAREIETLQYQISEIAEAGFQLGDDEDLAHHVAKLRNADGIASAIDAVLARIGDEGAAGHMEDAARALSHAAELDPSLGTLSEQLAGVLTALSDVSAEAVRYASDLSVEPARLQETEERIALLSSLRRKYGDSLESILGFHKSAIEREEELASLLGSADEIAERLEAATAAVLTEGERLIGVRRAAGARVAGAALVHLRDLGFTDPLLEIPIEHSIPSPQGTDTVEVRFASDSSLTPGPVSSIASGGELSRLVLALTLGSGGADADVVAFDEIDAGVGGETALALGNKLASLATGRQVICVTHLPQVAAFAQRHYVVTREGASAQITETKGSDRTQELSRMLAGLTASEKGKEHAEELLAIAATQLS